MRIVTSALLALAMLTAPIAMATTPVLAQNASPAATATPAQLATGVQIVSNLKLFELLTYGGHSGILQNSTITAMPEADQDKILTLFDEEMSTRRNDAIRAMAQANVGAYSADQLSELLALSKIQYVQELVLAGGDPSLATPDETTMSDSERTRFNTMMAEPWVNDFFTKFDYSTAAPSVGDAASAAMTRFADAAPAQPAN